MEAKPNSSESPTWLARTSFFLRSRGLQAQRLVQDSLRHLPLLGQGAAEDFPYILAESISALRTASDPREQPLILGKIQNLRVACRSLHSRVLAAGETFSLWRQIGPPWRLRGFVQGREVREGCVIPTFGGGLCQLSGSLLEVAMAAGFEVLERHTHTALPQDIPRLPQRDATLFWNYVDLRFRSPVPVLLECFLTEAALVLRVRGKTPRTAPQLRIAEPIDEASARTTHIESCVTCDRTECSRHVEVRFNGGKTAFLLEDYQPEFARLLGEHIKDGDQLLVPFVSPNGWRPSLNGFGGELRSSRWFRLRRSAALRWATLRGLTVAKPYFEFSQVLADLYAHWLAYDAEHVCVAQNLLPYLWRAGLLGGRTFDVLMQRLPVAFLERQLDEATRLYPDSKTLVEFRAPRWFVAAEEQALREARAIFTPHTQIASLYDRATCLPWERPARLTPACAKPAQSGGPGRNGNAATRDLILFAGPTLARKGAYAVREAARRAGLSLTIVGSDLEGPGFWEELAVTRVSNREIPWERVHTVVQPALVEYWPRQLLKAHAAGANLVITPLCGIAENPSAGIYYVPFGNVDILAATLTRLFQTQET
jgi:hypothetical protein